METSSPIRKIHPLVATAAVAVILASGVGIAAMTGVLPGAHGQNQDQQAGLIDSTGQMHAGDTPTGVALPASSTAAAPVAAGQTAPAAPATNMAPAAAVPPPPGTPAPPQPAAAPCTNCGVVEAVRQVEHQAQTSGVGAVAGALIGGVIGNRFGGGNGRALSTAAGAVGGGFAGNAIEKHGKTSISYQVTVKMENGKVRHFNYAAQPGWNIGDRVQVVQGTLEHV